MKVKDTKGKVHSWNLNGYVPPQNDIRQRSELHLKARGLLKELFTNDSILEEVPLPGEKLYCDFYLPLRKLAIEVHGEQHYKYVSHFHGSIKEFIASKERDARKLEWFRLNNIQLLVLPYNETNKWKEIINGRHD